MCLNRGFFRVVRLVAPTSVCSWSHLWPPCLKQIDSERVAQTFYTYSTGVISYLENAAVTFPPSRSAAFLGSSDVRQAVGFSPPFRLYFLCGTLEPWAVSQKQARCSRSDIHLSTVILTSIFFITAMLNRHQAKWPLLLLAAFIPGKEDLWCFSVNTGRHVRRKNLFLLIFWNGFEK